MDFSEVRVYQPGDDIRSIDWKVTARTLTTHTKVFQEERERPVLILLDQSPSMYFGSQVRFKSVSAVRLAATIGWAALDQGDRVGGIVFNQETHREVRPRRSRKSLLRFIHDAIEFNHHLASASNFDPKHGLSDMLTAAQRSSRHGSLVFIISDFHGVDQSLEQQIGQLGRYNEVHAICIFDPLEEKLPPPGRYTITNGQAVKEIDTSSAESRRRHQQDFSNHKGLLDQLFSRHSGACTHVPCCCLTRRLPQPIDVEAPPMRQQPAGTTSDPLAELRDIHLPEVVSGWPPATGWWILAGLGLIAIGFLSFLLIQRFQRSAYRRRAQRELSAIEEQYKRSENSKAALAALQQVLKRTALAAYSREQVAGLTGYGMDSLPRPIRQHYPIQFGDRGTVNRCPLQVSTRAFC
jgi:uncharacterized protein (DUF58 family)